MQSIKQLTAAIVAVSFIAAAGVAVGITIGATDAYAASTYSAWATKKGPGKHKWFFGTGTSLSEAKQGALGMCGRRCTIRKSGKGCVTVRLRGSGKVLRPRGLCS